MADGAFEEAGAYFAMDEGSISSTLFSHWGRRPQSEQCPINVGHGSLSAGRCWGDKNTSSPPCWLARHGRSHVQGSDGGAGDSQAPLFGDVLVILAQLAAAMQFIVEEKYLAKFRVPALLAVGLEGFWGLVISAIALPLLTVVKGPGGVPFDDAIQALRVGPAGLLHYGILWYFMMHFASPMVVLVCSGLPLTCRISIPPVRALTSWLATA